MSGNFRVYVQPPDIEGAGVDDGDCWIKRIRLAGERGM